MSHYNIMNNIGVVTSRAPSRPVWGDCPIEEFQADRGYGRYWIDDFEMAGNADMTAAYQNSIGAWSVYGYAGAFVNDQALDGGVIGIGSNGDNEGVCMISSAGSVRLVKSVAGTLFPTKKTWFEASVGTSTVAATKRDDFVGLVIPALSSNLPRVAYPITTTDDTLDATNGTFIGFHRKGTAAPTDWQFVFNLAGGTINYVTGLTTLLATAQVNQALPVISPLVANQLVKLAFVMDPNQSPRAVATPTARQTAGQLGTPLIRVFVNGIEIWQTFLSGLDVLNATATQAFPTGFMAPCIATMNQTGTTPGAMLADFIATAQFADS